MMQGTKAATIADISVGPCLGLTKAAIVIGLNALSPSTHSCFLTPLPTEVLQVNLYPRVSFSGLCPVLVIYLLLPFPFFCFCFVLSLLSDIEAGLIAAITLSYLPDLN